MDDYIGNILLWPMPWAPRYYFICDGSILNINEYQSLYSLIGNMYGGDGISTFALPDFRKRTPIGAGNAPDRHGYNIGDIGGAESVQLTVPNLPAHKHLSGFSAKEKCSTAAANHNNPQNHFNAAPSPTGLNPYSGTPSSGGFMLPFAVDIQQNTVGGNTPHNNMPPYLTINYIICHSGVYPYQD